MPSYHISSSGKLVQCKNDPCKLHAGSDFQAENLKEARKIAEKAIGSNNVSASLKSETKADSFNNIDASTRTLAEVYYGAGIMLENASTKLHELEAVDSENFNKASKLSDERIKHLAKTVKDKEKQNSLTIIWKPEKITTIVEKCFLLLGIITIVKLFLVKNMTA